MAFAANRYQPPPGQLFFSPAELSSRGRKQVWGPSPTSRSSRRELGEFARARS